MLGHNSRVSNQNRRTSPIDRNDIGSIWAAFTSGQIEEARNRCERLLDTTPGNPEAWHLSGLIANRQGNGEKALDCLKRAISIDPRNSQYHNNLGVLLRSQGRIAEAIACYQTTLSLAPENAEAHSNLGAALRLKGDYQAAIGSCRQAIRLSPDHGDGYFNLALTYQAMGLGSEAICAYRNLLKFKPTDHVAWHNLGTALLNQNQFDQASLCIERALEIEGRYPEAYNSLSNVRRVQKQIDEALDLAQKALALRPDYPDGLAHAAVLYQQACGWNQLAQIEPDLTRQTVSALSADSRPAETPLFAVGFRPDPQINCAIASQWSRTCEVRAAQLGVQFDFSKKPLNPARITIGYLSSDFRDHPVAHQILGMPAAHDRGDFRVFLYSTGPDDNSLYRKHLARSCDKFVDIRNLQDPEAASQIYNDGVDILIDLNGHTAGNRLGICALRPAPIQATYLGFPGTSGADFLDYIITDRIVTPEADLGCYSEKPVYLPHSYMITDDTQDIQDLPMTRSDAGLPENSFIFCSFNSAYKFEPVLFKVWMTILNQVPDSCLWLPKTNALTMQAIEDAAGSYGIASGRLIFAPKLVAKQDYLSRLRLADLGLDTRVYNGHVSTCDALWAGVPVLTVAGSHFASRVSASILTALDINELITANVEDYAAAAVYFATHPSELVRLRDKLLRHRLTQPFFDTRRFVCHLEEAYSEMWRVYQKGESPRRINISTD